MTDEGVVLALNRIAESIERTPVIIPVSRHTTTEDAIEIKDRIQRLVGPNRPVIIIRNSGPGQSPERQPEPASSNGFA